MKEMNRMISRRKFLKATVSANAAFTAGLSSTRAAGGSVGGETYKTKQTIELSSDNPPDVYYSWEGGRAKELIDNGFPADLSPYYAKYGWDKSLILGSRVEAMRTENRQIPSWSKRFLCIALAALLAGVAPFGAMAAEPLVVGYVTKSATNQGWILINQGATDAAKEAGVDLITVGATTAHDLGGQLATIENMISRHVAALAIAPVDSSGVVPAVKKAIADKIPVVAVDTAIYDAPVASFVATDNVAAADDQGKWVAQQIADDGEVILVNGLIAQSTGRDRHDGFLKALQAAKPHATIYEVQTKWDQTEAQNGVETLLRAHPKVAAVANAWDGATMGTIAALKGLHKGPGQVKVAGFDGAPDALQQIGLGWVQCDVAQHLYKIGHDGIATAIKAARGEAVAERIDTGHAVVTSDNVKQFIVDNHLEKFMQ
jgi:ABC-type sugar transport system substrate-binding protein